MKVLNLVNKETSEIQYEVSHFPDGQNQVKILSPLNFWIPGDPIEIKARLNNFKDLEIILCTVASLRGLGVEDIHLYVPYFGGSRSDRKFEIGSNNYLKDVICPIINSLKLNSVTVLDPHSDVLEACLVNFKKLNNLNLVSWSTAYCGIGSGSFIDYLDKFIIVSPDAGATKKIFKLAEEIGYKENIITCSKSRGVDGKLSKVTVPLTPTNLGKDMIIIDDICDGGATFINIAKAIKAFEQNYKSIPSKIYLVVTHGIFSKEFEELSKYFDNIYCTNSYRDIKSMSTSRSMNWLKQLNIF